MNAKVTKNTEVECSFSCGISRSRVRQLIIDFGAPSDPIQFKEWYRERKEKRKSTKRSEESYWESLARKHPRSNWWKSLGRNKNPLSRRKYDRKRESSPHGKLRNQLKARIHKALRAQNVTKRNGTFQLCGCSPQFLREWLQSQFTRGMTWKNQGTYWHIDHKIPVSTFDLSNSDQQRAAFHYSNLQPLRSFDNMSKHDRILPTQPELVIPIHL